MSLSPERRQILTHKAETFTKELHQAMPYLFERGISQQVAEMFNLGFVPAGSEFGYRLSIPYNRPAGVVQIKYRCIKPDHHDNLKHVHETCPKYLYEAGASIHLFNTPVLMQETGLVVVTEGELDAICVQAYCGIAAVGYPGAKSWTKHQAHYRLCFEAVNEVVVVADGDDTGREAARRVAESIGHNARTVELPDGDDANSLIARDGAQAFIERIRS